MGTLRADCCDDLWLDDCRRIVDVMDAVAEATSRADLCDRLLSSLAREFGWTDAFLLEDETVSRRAAGLLWIHVATGPVVTAVIGVPLAAGRWADARERSISHWLGRLLVPAFRVHFGGRSRNGGQWSLTEREREVADLVAAGMTNRQVAEHLHVTVDTVKKHITNVLRKTGCASRTRLAVLWRQTLWVRAAERATRPGRNGTVVSGRRKDPGRSPRGPEAGCGAAGPAPSRAATRQRAASGRQRMPEPVRAAALQRCPVAGPAHDGADPLRGHRPVWPPHRGEHRPRRTGDGRR
jgi:DNA-binding CsgD family transcriptional regulator